MKSEDERVGGGAARQLPRPGGSTGAGRPSPPARASPPPRNRSLQAAQQGAGGGSGETCCDMEGRVAVHVPVIDLAGWLGEETVSPIVSLVLHARARPWRHRTRRHGHMLLTPAGRPPGSLEHTGREQSCRRSPVRLPEVSSAPQVTSAACTTRSYVDSDLYRFLLLVVVEEMLQGGSAIRANREGWREFNLLLTNFQ